MKELWIVEILAAGIVLVLAIVLAFMVTALIQKIFIWIETFEGRITRVTLNLLVILMIMLIGLFLLQLLFSFMMSFILS
ncbi:MAG: Unknown protein [uncultured Sulfurovum sp.]|uniref:Uncharacterized protein n=1 Tax=uncultured Sulfurovum sp. TaxID=269237 RepID=A0A6S6SE29_9BACT|nr:MAG: Unknown protein [uncultured Sulfurovum sp.]